MANDAQMESVKTVKSVLDGIPVKDEAFPLNKNNTTLGIVGHCPNCGCPIYGQNYTKMCDNPEIKRTCVCWVPVNPFGQPMRTT